MIMETNISKIQPEEKSKGFGHFLLLFAVFIIGFLALIKGVMWLVGE
jgi:hypothetical protein